MNQKTFYIGFCIVLAVIIGGLFFLSKTDTATPPRQGSAVSAPQIYSETNSSTTVNTTSTQVIPAGWQNYAAISTGSTTISCYLDGQQIAASSSVQVGAGFIIQANSRATFGPLGDNPYVGPINCRGAGLSVVGTSRN